MKEYLIRKESFGGVVMDLQRYITSSITKNEMAVIEMISKKQSGESNIAIVGTNLFDSETLSAPLSVTLYPSFACNIKCDFCFVNPIKDAFNHNMSFEEFCAAVDIIKKWGVFDVEIMGGEPFIIPWIIDGIKYIVDKDMHCSINTNGLSLSTEMIYELASLPHLSFRVSVQAPWVKNHPSRQLLRIAKEAGLKADVITVLRPNTKDLLPEILNSISTPNIKNLIVLYNTPPKGELPEYSPKWFYEEVEKLKYYAKEHSCCNVVGKGPYGHYNQNRGTSVLPELLDGYCIAGVSRIEIFPSGGVYPCTKFFCQPEYLMGNIFENSLTEIWTGKVAEDFRKLMYAHSTNMKCDCEWKGHCSGCMGYALGRNLERDDRCPSPKNSF